MTWTLRRWQAEALPLALEALNAGKAGVISAVMGSGKSVLISEVCRQAPPDLTVVVTAPRVRLVEQLAETISRAVGASDVGLWYQQEHRISRVVISTLQSVDSLADALGSRAVWWIADEVHRTETDRIKAVIDQISPVARIGFSATPYLADEGSLTLWDHEIYTYTPAQAMGDGVIVPYEIVPWQGADIDLDEAVTQMIRQGLQTGSIEGPGLANAATIAEAEEYAAALTDAGVEAQAIHSQMPYREQQQVIDRLRTGVIRVGVHVSMLAEGVDMPWLRWMALRRPVRSRVRFVQEVGRGLRAYEGKDKCIYLDPLGLFAAFSLTYEASLGWEEKAATGSKGRKLTREQIEQAERRQLQAWGWSPEDAYLRQLAILVAPPEKMRPAGSYAWRLDQPTDGQMSAIKRLAWSLERYPEDIGAWLADMVRAGGPWTRGGASDMITVMIAAATSARSGTSPLPEGVAPPQPPAITPEDIERIGGQGPVYVAQAWKQGIWAIAVVRRGRVVYTDAGASTGNWRSTMRMMIGLALDAVGSPEDVITDAWTAKVVPNAYMVQVVGDNDNAARPAAWRARKKYLAQQTPGQGW